MEHFVVGVTGGIASGKTLFANELIAKKCEVIDADILAREVVQFGSTGYAQLEAAFPHVFLNGVLDRSKLRKVVFDSLTELQKLNAITHPLIRNLGLERIAAAKKKLVFFVCPMLFETGFNSLCDYTVCVFVSAGVQASRLVERDGISIDLANKMIGSQMDTARLKSLCDEVIFNDGSEEELKKKAEEFYLRMLHRI